MKNILTIFTISIAQLISAQDESAWDGAFTGSILGTYAVLTANLSGTLWSGTISVEKNPFQPPNTMGANIDEHTNIRLEGTVNGDECTGNMRDDHSQKSSQFTAHANGSQINIKVHELNPLSGFYEDLTLTFSKNVPTSYSVPAVNSNMVQMDDGTYLDQNLMGLWWSATEELNKGFVTSTDFYLQFNQNGTLLLSEGRDGNLDYPDALHSEDSDVQTLNWKVDKRTIWVQHENQWIPFARYQGDSETMVLVFGNKKKETWQKL